MIPTPLKTLPPVIPASVESLAPSIQVLPDTLPPAVEIGIVLFSPMSRASRDLIGATLEMPGRLLVPAFVQKVCPPLQACAVFIAAFLHPSLVPVPFAVQVMGRSLATPLQAMLDAITPVIHAALNAVAEIGQRRQAEQQAQRGSER